jgi:predicted GTPase
VSGTSRLRTLLLRWDSVLALAALLIPLGVTVMAGFFWLIENGWLIPFVACSIAFGGAVSLLRLALRRWRPKPAPPPAAIEAVQVDADPDWSAAERKAFVDARALIRQRTEVAVPWPDMQALALEVVTVVAQASGPSGKQPLDFTLPEALLLAERVTGRVRGDLRTHVPFSDTLSLRTLTWLWRQRGRAQVAAKAGQVVWRVGRFMQSPPVAILREIDGAIAGGHSNYLTAEAMATGQALLLEELARAAVDLYSGRLRFSDAELLDLRMASGEVDRDRLAEPDAPLRIAVVGQVSAGKSTLINALRGEDQAETDIAPTTEGVTSYPASFDGLDSVLLDLPGLDGRKATLDAVLRAATDSDVVIWVVRADRPAREIDRAGIAAWRAAIAAMPQRRAPPLICVATGLDRLAPGWPYPEHLLPPEVSATFAEVVTAIGAAVEAGPFIPVVSTEPDWNIGSVRQRLDGVMAEGLMVQRNRARLAGAGGAFGREAARTAAGLSKGIQVLGRQIGTRSGLLDRD